MYPRAVQFAVAERAERRGSARSRVSISAYLRRSTISAIVNRRRIGGKKMPSLVWTKAKTHEMRQPRKAGSDGKRTTIGMKRKKHADSARSESCWRGLKARLDALCALISVHKARQAAFEASAREAGPFARTCGVTDPCAGRAAVPRSES
eukprot:3798561-Pleurochrysis_carterae.AAC.1